MTKVAVIAHAGKTIGGGLEELRTVLSRAGVTDPIWSEVPKSRYAPERVQRMWNVHFHSVPQFQLRVPPMGFNDVVWALVTFSIPRFHFWFQAVVFNEVSRWLVSPDSSPTDAAAARARAAR